MMMVKHKLSKEEQARNNVEMDVYVEIRKKMDKSICWGVYERVRTNVRNEVLMIAYIDSVCRVMWRNLREKV